MKNKITKIKLITMGKAEEKLAEIINKKDDKINSLKLKGIE